MQDKIENSNNEEFDNMNNKLVSHVQEKSAKSKKFWIIALGFSILLLIGAIFYKFFIWDAASLANGVKEKWANSAEIKFSSIDNDFEPYTILLSGEGEDAKLAVITPKGNGEASYYEISLKTGKILDEKPKDLPTCDFSKHKRYQAKDGKLICTDFQPEQHDNTVDGKGLEAGKKTSTAKVKGELIYQSANFQIRVAPLNGAMAKQIVGCNKDGTKVLWIYDLKKSGYVTIDNGNFYVTTLLVDKEKSKLHQVIVTALMPASRGEALPTKSEKDVATLPKDAIKQLDLNNLVYPLNFGHDNRYNCVLSEIKAGADIPQVPKNPEPGGCFTQVVGGKAVVKVKDGMPPYDMVPVIDFHSVKSKELVDKKGILEFHNGENTETFYLDVNNDGYLDAIREGFMPDGSGALAYYLIIFNPSQPNQPFSTFLYGTQGAEVLKFLDGKLSLGYFETPIEDPLGMIFWEMKIENRNNTPYIKDFKRYRDH